MNVKQYFKNQIPKFLLNLFCMAALALFLLVNGSTIDSVILILSVWLLILAVHTALTCALRKKQLDRLLSMSEQLKERYLIAELMQFPERADDQVYRRLLKSAEKSMLERIGTVERERAEYKEYIEQWIHEVKTPITAMKLLCDNNRSPLTRELLAELEKTGRYTEQALFYARSEHAERDYLVREIRLFDAVHQSVADNKYLLLRNDVRLDLQESEETVYSDDKWVSFILNQLIANAVKYSDGQLALKIYSERLGDQVFLYVQDNGVGIPAADLPRIFDKGFTGENGRKKAQNATGIGLYLCKKLCDKLGIGISASSVASSDIPSDPVSGTAVSSTPGEASDTSTASGTTVCLSFYINNFIHQVQS